MARAMALYGSFTCFLFPICTRLVFRFFSVHVQPRTGKGTAYFHDFAHLSSSLGAWLGLKRLFLLMAKPQVYELPSAVHCGFHSTLEFASPVSEVTPSPNLVDLLHTWHVQVYSPWACLTLSHYCDLEWWTLSSSPLALTHSPLDRSRVHCIRVIRRASTQFHQRHVAATSL